MTSFFTNHGGALQHDRRRGRSDATAAGRTEEASRITVAGALFLGIVAVLPFFVKTATGFQTLTISSTAVLIVVGVALDTMRQLEAQLIMRNYRGFIGR